MTEARPLSVDEAREALERHVADTLLLRRGIARSLAITSHRTPGAHHVIFESFTEARCTAPTHRPYAGGPIDGPESGAVPGEWEVPATPEAVFATETKHFVLPHTELVRTCHHCSGRGTVSCGSCGGSGSVTCSSCGGSGSISRTRTVTTTDSAGQSQTTTESYSEWCASTQTCSGCGGCGSVMCSPCSGGGRLLHYTRLTVSWVNHVADRVLEHTELPDELVTRAAGVTALQEIEYRVDPSPGSGVGGGAFRGGALRVDAAVDAAANALITSQAFGAELKLLQQRLTVRAVPVFEAEYTWGDRTRYFWVYGTDRLVHAPSYPLSRGRIAFGLGALLAAGAGVFGYVHAQGTHAPPPDPSADVAISVPAVDEPATPPIAVVPVVFDAGGYDADESTAGRPRPIPSTTAHRPSPREHHRRR